MTALPHLHPPLLRPPLLRALPPGLPGAREVKLLPEAPRPLAEGGDFEGYASLFGVADLARDVVAAGAFAGSLRRRGTSGVRLLWQHDPAQPIGRWLELTEDARGLFVRGRLNLEVARAREVHALLREGAVDGLSIGFRVERAAKDRAGALRRLVEIDLWEISVVTLPAQPSARVSAVKGRAPASPIAAAIRAATGRVFRA